jgi:carbamoyltransferase
MYILGINSAYHESSVCLLHDGCLIAAVEEERFNRVKHGKLPRIDNPQQLPASSIKYCLEAGGISFAEIEHIGFAFDPALRLQNIGKDDLASDDDWGGRNAELKFHALITSIPELLTRQLGMSHKTRFHWLPHHVCHASSAYFVSPFDQSAVLTIDGIGEFATTQAAWGSGNRLEVLWEIDYPHSLGFLWEKLSRFLGFGEYDACKVMGLAAYGDPNSHAAAFQRLVQVTPSGFTVNATLLQFRQFESFAGLEQVLGPRRQPDSPLQPRHKDMAACLQQTTEQAFLQLAQRLKTSVDSDNLCLAGGVALNCRANQILQERGPFKHVFVQPAAHDAGTALGAAYWIWHQVLNQPKAQGLTSVYLGPVYADAELEAAIQAQGLRYYRSRDVVTETAQLLADGNIVAWFQGRMEFGPRALGNRSLLADPRDPGMREKINQKVKHRDAFRPFGPSITEKAAPDWFQLPGVGSVPSPSEFMLSTHAIKPGQAARIPAVVHHDHTSRLQVVREYINPIFHALLDAFGSLTGVPILLNTSFNDSEPIVCSPHDALNTFCKTQIDCLVLGQFIVKRNP